jgi:hypothetical protein
MKRNIAWMLLPISLFVVLAGTNAYGQSSTKLKVNIPFDFRVGSQSLPAGEYTVAPKSPTMVVIRSKDGHQSAPALTNDVQVNPGQGDGKLIFNCYGAYHFLSQIWTPGEETGRKLIRSKIEQEVANLASQSDTTVLIAEKVKK